MEKETEELVNKYPAIPAEYVRAMCYLRDNHINQRFLTSNDDHDSHKYYPEPGWYWKWVIGAFILLCGGSLMIYKFYEVLR